MPDWSLRPAGADDTAFLQRVYASTRLEELAATGWADDRLQAFLAMQFQAQDRHYRWQFPAAQVEIVEVAGTGVGRLCTERCDGAIRLLDIALLPEHRCRGLGSSILRALLTEAAEAGLAVSLHVEIGNPAHRLYERLGFVPTELHGIHQRMDWRPAAPPSTCTRSTRFHQELTHEQST